MKFRAQPKRHTVCLFFLLASLITLVAVSVGARRESAGLAQSAARGQSHSVFVFQDNFWVNLHHVLRGEARRRGHGLPLQLPLAELGLDEKTVWESALDAYQDLAKRAFIFDETLTRIDNALAMQTASTLAPTDWIDAKFIAAMNQAAPIYRAHRWNQDHSENENWLATHASPILLRAAAVRSEIAKIFDLKPPGEPILVEVVSEIGPNLAYTTGGPNGFSGHTFISPPANANLDVALDTILHEISHTMDDQIIAVIEVEAARQHVKIPQDMWHAMTLYTTYELVRRELGRQRDDLSYAPNASFANMFKDGNWPVIFSDLRANWQVYLDGHGNLNEALVAVVANAPH
jgi:hypothetical protein